MFNKYKYYIEEKELLNWNLERIDFKVLFEYNFEKEKELLLNIIDYYFELNTKWYEIDDMKSKVLDKVKVFERYMWINDIRYWWTQNWWRWNSIDIDFEDSSIKVTLKKFDTYIRKYIWDLEKTSWYNNLNKNNIANKKFYWNRYKYERDWDKIDANYFEIKKFEDIDQFFNDFKTWLLDIAAQGFQVGYNEKKKEYRKLLFFEGDYKLDDKIGSDILDPFEEEKFWSFSFDTLSIKYESLYWIIWEANEYWLYESDIWKYVLENWKEVFIKTLWIKKLELKNTYSRVWIYISFDELTPDLLVFLEELYYFRRNHVVENTNTKVLDLLDLLDFSPYNYRLNNKNRARANLVIREVLDNKKYFMLSDNQKKLIESIRDREELWAWITENIVKSNNFDKQKLKTNRNIDDFIFEKEKTEYEILEFDNFKVVELKKQWGNSKFIRLDTFEPWIISYQIWETLYNERIEKYKSHMDINYLFRNNNKGWIGQYLLEVNDKQFLYSSKIQKYRNMDDYERELLFYLQLIKNHETINR